MKKLLFLITLMITAATTHLSAASLSVENLTIQAGQNGQLAVSMTNTETNLSGFQFRLYLPEGLTIATNTNGKFQYTLGDRIANHSLTIRALNDGGYQFIAYSMDGDAIIGTSGVLLNVPVVPTENFVSGDGTISDIRLTDLNANKTTCSNVSFTITRMIPATGITLSQTALSFNAANQAVTLTATVTPASATNKSVTWTSSNTSVATVSSIGVVTAVANGTATITATTADGTNLTATCTVTVAIPVIINFTDANAKAICVANWDTNGDGELSEEEAAAVTSLGDVFKGNTEITSFDELRYFTGLTEIGASAFQNCNHLSMITIPDGVTSIQTIAFGWCSSLSTINWGGGVTSLGWYVFQNCINLKNINIPASLISIGTGAFNNCSNIETIHVEDGNTKYDSRNSCNAIIETNTNKLILGCKNTTIPSTVTLIGNNAFSGCIGLTFVIIPECITSIGQFAYSSCTGLTSLAIPNNIASIGASAFTGCNQLTEVRVGIEVPLSIDSSTFSNRANATLIVPAGCKEAYQAADYWQDFKRIIEDIDGDVNGDGETDVLDVVDIARFVVGTPAETFVQILADMNSDGQVNIGDAVTLVNEIAGDQNFVKPMMAPRKITADEESLSLTEGNNELSLALENQRSYTAFQFDLYLAEGVDVTTMMLNAQRKQKHQLLYNKVENGHWRVTAFSTSNRSFQGNDGELLSFALDTEGDIALRNIQFFDAEGNGYQFDDICQSGVTGVKAIDHSPLTIDHSNIYDIQGRRHTKLQRGLNIVNGKKVFVK